LVQCFGGCGRSGMVALRLMRRTGLPADLALSHLRAIRPCAIETTEQEHWARATFED
jgi:protein-tyrosine phosphatase